MAKSHSLEALPSTLIQARIARGLSQSDLAESLDIEPQQVQRYEASEYMGASLAELIEAANILNVHTAGLFEAEVAIEAWLFHGIVLTTCAGKSFHPEKW